MAQKKRSKSSSFAFFKKKTKQNNYQIWNLGGAFQHNLKIIDYWWKGRKWTDCCIHVHALHRKISIPCIRELQTNNIQNLFLGRTNIILGPFSHAHTMILLQFVLDNFVNKTNWFKWIKGVRFLRNWGAALVGEYNKVI